VAHILEKLVLKQGAEATISISPQRDHALTPILTFPQGKTAHGLFILQCSNYLIG
jgi:hypothetical protein